ncbi:MAG: hypothetical protein BWX69_03140 [Planctomycetes bacterium ADurb.Bin069]|nr:MAG: hypothetical protein BWX69_03140 [Planctomycetes bacterium ADurb.Bin069]
MRAADFEAWITRMGWSGLEAARRLGTSKNSVVRYRREGAPLTVALACAALAAGLGPWKGEPEEDGDG